MELTHKNQISKKYIQSILIFFIFVIITQLTFSKMWSGELNKLDLFQIIIAPACCFAIATMTGWYKNFLTTFFSGITTLILGSLFYFTFQKFTFYKEATYESLFTMNASVMGKEILITILIASLVNAVVIHFLNKKNKM